MQGGPMSEFGLALASGILYGLSLLLTTIGLTLIFGVGRVVNFAHGAIYALGAFLGASLAPLIGFAAAVLVVPVLIAVCAIVLERTVIRRLRRISGDGQRAEAAYLHWHSLLVSLSSASLCGLCL